MCFSSLWRCALYEKNVLAEASCCLIWGINPFLLPQVLKVTNVGLFFIGLQGCSCHILNSFSTLLMVKPRILHKGARINVRGGIREWSPLVITTVKEHWAFLCCSSVSRKRTEKEREGRKNVWKYRRINHSLSVACCAPKASEHALGGMKVRCTKWG